MFLTHSRTDEFDFWRLWFAGLVLFSVRFIDTTTFAIYVYEREGSAFLVAIVTLLRIAPMAMFAAVIGGVMNRVHRHTALLFVLGGTLITSAILAGLAVTGNLQTWHLAVASFVSGFGWAADNPVRRTGMGELVRPDRLGVAMAIDVGSNNSCRVAGPIVGGLLLATTGIQGTFFVDATLALAAIVAVSQIRYRSYVSTDSIREMLVRLGSGFKLGFTDAYLRAILILTLINSLFAIPYTSMIPVIGADFLHLDSRGIGILAGMEGIGAFAAIFAIALRISPTRYGLVLITGTAIFQIAAILFGFVEQPITAGLIVFLGGLGNAAVAIIQTTLVITYANAEMRSHMLGVLATCNGLAVIGFIGIGWLAEAAGAKVAILVIALLGAILLGATLPLWWFLGRPLGLPDKSAKT